MSYTPESAPPPGPPPGGYVLHPEHTPAVVGRRRKKQSFRSMLVEYALTLVVALVIAVLIKTFLVQPFFIPSASMRPTLMENDKIAVSKLHPGVFDIERGDVIVFSDPGNWVGIDPQAELGTRQRVLKIFSYVGLAPDPAHNHLVKRLIGMPGDRVSCEEIGGALSVNGVSLDEPYIDPDSGACQHVFEVTVPAGKLWVMGDNRFHSADSVWHHAQGENPFVDESLVTGRAVAIFLPFDRWSTLSEGREAFAPVAARAGAASGTVHAGSTSAPHVRPDALTLV